MSELTNNQFLEELVEIDALKFGSFTLASGDISEFYLDLRYLPAFPGLFKNLMYRLHNQILSKLDYDVIIGIPTAGIPFASAIATLFDKPTQILRKKPKLHGRGQQIEGPELKSRRVLLIDDLISSGYSKEFAITSIREAGAIVDDLVVLVDRSQGRANSWSEQFNINFHSLFELSKVDILNFRD